MQPHDISDLVLHDVPPEMQPVVRYLATGNTNQYMISQLITKSKQPHILQYTPSDAGRRFVDEHSYQDWLNQGHTVHWLLDESYDLAGILWYRTKQPPVTLAVFKQTTDTFAIRLYENYIGKRLSKPFMLLSLQVLRSDLQTEHKTMPGLWLETTVGNEAAISSYSTFGYTEVYRDEEHVLMVMNAQALDRLIDSA
jgi:hypothetical protein